jgi:uncharacterized protein (TIGR00296 family)
MNGELRGCIGNFSPNKLSKNLSKYCLIAALEDTRFPPITMSELPELKCCISLLTDFEEMKDPFEWEVGTHGIEIEFKGPNGREYGGTFLPEVAPEQGWDKEKTLKHLIKKGGFKGTIEDVKDRFTMLKRY